MQKAIESMWKSMSVINDKTNEEDNIIDKERLSNLKSNVSCVKKEVASVNDKLDIILKLLSHY